MEKYQDCGWFRTGSANLSTVEPMIGISADADALCNTPFGIWDGEDQGATPEGWPTPEDYPINLGEDISYNLNDYLIRKSDSFDDMKDFSSVDPATIVPISYKERVNSRMDVEEFEVKTEEVEIQDMKNMDLYNDWVEEEEEVETTDMAEVEIGLQDKAMVKFSALDLDLSQSLRKTEMEIPFINTPDIEDFMQLVGFVNNHETPPVAEASEVALSPSSVASSFSSLASPPPSVPTTVADTSDSLHAPATTIDMSQFRAATIAEVVKTGSKRRRPTRYAVTSEDEEDVDDDNDKDYQLDEEEEEEKPRARRAVKRRRTTTKETPDRPPTEREKRIKNNEASKRSRENRKTKERDMEWKLRDEERRNVDLRARADELEKLVKSHRTLMLMMAKRKN